jgi:hypothetical protein
MGPGFEGKTLIVVESATLSDTATLLEKLDDPRASAAAHIILARLYLEQPEADEQSFSEETWYGLVFDVDGTLRGHYEPSQRKSLKDAWIDRLKRTP